MHRLGWGDTEVKTDQTIVILSSSSHTSVSKRGKEETTVGGELPGDLNAGIPFLSSRFRKALKLAGEANGPGGGRLERRLMIQCVVAPDKETCEGLQQDKAVNLMCVLVTVRKAGFGKENRIILGEPKVAGRYC